MAKQRKQPGKTEKAAPFLAFRAPYPSALTTNYHVASPDLSLYIKNVINPLKSKEGAIAERVFI